MNIKVFPNTTPISIWMRVKRFSLQSMKNTATVVALIAVAMTTLPSHFAFADSTDVSSPAPVQAEGEPPSSNVEVSVDIPSDPIVSVIRTYAYVPMTAYTSRPEETDDSPFITADGSHVADGIIAANFLPFGTKVRIPALFGDKVFEVHDRMNQRYSYKVDVWMAGYHEAIQFGVRHADIEIVKVEQPNPPVAQNAMTTNEVAVINK
jgi:3D (Asp-Asp-Asp) domain-containing protein